jgi:hypothetical protein
MPLPAARLRPRSGPLARAIGIKTQKSVGTLNCQPMRRHGPPVGASHGRAGVEPGSMFGKRPNSPQGRLRPGLMLHSESKED